MKRLLFVALFGCTSTRTAMDSLLETYGDGHHGWRNASGYSKPNPVPATPKSLENGKRLYALHCAPCHGSSGRGDGVLAEHMATKPRDLTALQGDRSDYHVYLQIGFGEGDMPGRDLQESERWDLVNYVQAAIIPRGN